MSDPATAGSGNSWLPPQRSSAAMSFQSAIPWRVALRQSLPPLRRLATILNNPLCRTMIFQRTATTPLTSCLSPRVHSIAHPCSALTPNFAVPRPNGQGCAQCQSIPQVRAFANSVLASFLLLWTAPVSGHRAVTRHFRVLSSQRIRGATNMFEARVQSGFCEWCREGESNPQGPKPGGF